MAPDQTRPNQASPAACLIISTDQETGTSQPEILYCVLGQDTFLSQCHCPPICTNGTEEFKAEGNPAMDQLPIQGGGEQKYFQSFHATVTGDKLQLDEPFWIRKSVFASKTVVVNSRFITVFVIFFSQLFASRDLLLSKSVEVYEGYRKEHMNAR